MMKAHTPFLLVRARPAEPIRDRFAAWFRGVHLKDVARIPGIATIESGRTGRGAWLGIISFDDAEKVQEALASPQAAYARGTWEQWAGDLDELQIEMFAPLGPLTLYHAVN